MEIDQIRTIDKSRILKITEELTKKEIENVKQTINKTFVL